MKNVIWTRRLAPAILIAVAMTACGRNPEKTRETRMAAGDAYALQGKYKEAIIEYRGAIQAVPRFGPAHKKLAEAYVAVGDGANALKEYLRAAELLPADDALQLKAGQALLLAGQFDGAKDRATKLLAKNDKNVEARILLGNAMAAMKDLDGAISEVEDAIDKDPHRGLSYTNLGVLQAARGEREDAERAFKQAVEIDPTSANAVLALGNFYWSDKRYAEAESAFKQAEGLDPDSIGVHRALATFYLNTNRAPEAEPHLKAAAEHSTGIGARLVLADYYRAIARPEAAVAVLEQISKEQAGFLPAQTRLASIRYAAGAQADAHRIIDAVLVKYPKDVPAQLAKAGFLAAERRFADAMTHATVAVLSAPQSPAAQMMVGSLAALLNKPDDAIKSFQEVLKLRPNDAGAETALARLYAARSDWSDALQHAESAVRIAPRNGDAHVQLAQALIETGDLESAAAELKQLQANLPKEPSVQFILGRYYLKTNDRARARAAFAASLAAKDGELGPLAGLVQLDLLEGKSGDARVRLEEQLQKASPPSAAMLVFAGRTYEAVKDDKAAEAVLRQAIAVDPSALDGYQALARFFVRHQRLTEARAEFETIAQRDPKSVEAHTMAGMLLEQERNPAQARTHYEQALAIDPHAPVPANNLAWLMAESGGSLDMALQLAQTAKAGLPQRAEIDDTLGWIYYRKGLTSLAITSLSQSVNADPGDPVYQFHLGMAFVRNGEKDRARQVLEKALTIRPDFDGADEARRVLQSIT